MNPYGPDTADVLVRLVAAGIIDATSVVEGDLAVRDVSRSNRVLIVEPADVVVKIGLPERLGDQGSAERERSLLLALAERTADAPVPSCVWADGDMVVTVRVRPGDTIADRRHGPRWTNEPYLFGEAVARAHALVRVAADLDLPCRPPWVLDGLGDDSPEFITADENMTKLRDHLRADEVLVAALASASRAWGGDTLLHGDVRWDNALVETIDDRDRVVLVDWEFVDRGDPAWDVAGGLADAFIDLVRTSDVDTDDVAAATAAVGPYAQRFLSGYASVAGGPAPFDTVLLAARIVQAAFQHVAWQRTGAEAGRQFAEFAGRLVRTPPAW